MKRMGKTAWRKNSAITVPISNSPYCSRCGMAICLTGRSARCPVVENISSLLRRQASSIYRSVDLANERTTAFRLAAMNSHRNSACGQRLVSGDDFIDAMRRAARVSLRARNVIPQPRNRLATDIMCRRPADDFASVVGVVSDGDDFQ